jgi:hypothetical protein
MLEPDTRVATMDRYLTAIETIAATADAQATVIAGRPGYGVNSPAVCLVTARVSEDERTSMAAADFDARRAERRREVRRGTATPECQLTWVMR